MQLRITFENFYRIVEITLIFFLLQAKDREREEEEGEFIYPYDLGCWKNMGEVFTLNGKPKSDGFIWNIVPDCNQYTLTVSPFR